MEEHSCNSRVTVTARTSDSERAAPQGVSPSVTSLSVIVPVYNEQYLVRASLGRLLTLGNSPLLSRIKVIVVDDCSRDDTPRILLELQESFNRSVVGSKFDWLFLRHDRNQGKGGAIKTALEHADTQLTVIHDADLEYQPSDLLKMVPLFLEQNADAVFGSRFLGSEFKRVLFFRHSLGNGLLTFLSNLVCDLNLTDMETCYKMVRTELLRSIPLESRDFRIEPELTIKLAKRGAQIFEVPISYAGRTYQEGKKINWRDGLRAFQALIKFALSDQVYVADEFGSDKSVHLKRAPRFAKWMADKVRPHMGEHVLEIGAGVGNLTACLVPRFTYCVTDVNPLCLASLNNLSETRPYLKVEYTDVSDPRSFPTGQRFDTVLCLNILQNVQDDAAALQNICNVLDTGGHAIVLVPQGPYLYGSLDRILGHHRRYTKEQLIALGKGAQLRVCTLISFNRAGTPAWLLNGRILGRTTLALGQLRLFNILVPIIRRLDSWLPIPPLSLIAIFEK